MRNKFILSRKDHISLSSAVLTGPTGQNSGSVHLGVKVLSDCSVGVTYEAPTPNHVVIKVGMKRKRQQNIKLKREMGGIRIIQIKIRSKEGN